MLGDLGGLVNLLSYSSVGNHFFPFSFCWFSKQNRLPKGVCVFCSPGKPTAGQSIFVSEFSGMYVGSLGAPLGS